MVRINSFLIVSNGPQRLSGIVHVVINTSFICDNFVFIIYLNRIRIEIISMVFYTVFIMLTV